MECTLPGYHLWDEPARFCQQFPERIQLKESQDATAALMKFPVAKGKLWILDSRIKNSTEKQDPGSIRWIKFKVELRVPCNFHFVEDAGKIAVDTSVCGGSHGKNVN